MAGKRWKLVERLQGAALAVVWFVPGLVAHVMCLPKPRERKRRHPTFDN